MIIVLDSSAAIEFILNRQHKKSIESSLLKSDLVTAPDIFISEVSNVFWKYHRFDSLQKKIGEELIDKSIQLIDQFESSSTLYREAFNFACTTKHPVYDTLYIILARRNNGRLISLDKKLNLLAQSQSIKTLK